MLNNENIEGGPEFLKEIISSYSAGGSNLSYINYPREAYRKGIPLPTAKTFHGYDYKLFNDTTVKPYSDTLMLNSSQDPEPIPPAQ
jgi:hypothetical protein